MSREKEPISDALFEAFEEGFERLARRYPGSGTKAKLRLVRNVLGLSQKEFAEEFGLSFSTVRNWEQPNRGDPTGAAETLIELLAQDPKTIMRIMKQVNEAKGSENSSEHNNRQGSHAEGVSA